MVSSQRWNLWVEREIDGIIVYPQPAIGKTAAEVMARKVEEECLPGAVTTIRTKYVHGEDQSPPSDAHRAFAKLRRGFTDTLQRTGR